MANADLIRFRDLLTSDSGFQDKFREADGELSEGEPAQAVGLAVCPGVG